MLITRWMNRSIIIAVLTSITTVVLTIPAQTIAQRPSSPAIAQTIRTEEDLTAADLDAIATAIQEALERAELPEPQIDRIVVENSWGLVSYQMGEASGILALWQEEAWEVYPLGGGMPTADDINQETDIPVDVAQRLLDRLF